MLTVGQLKQLIQEHGLPDDTPVCLPYDATDISTIDININVASILVAEFSHSKEFRLTFATSNRFPSEGLTVRKLIGQNQWSTKIFNLMRL